jgi:hypothetical protein
VQQGVEQVERLDLGMAKFRRQRLRIGNGLLAFDREFFVAKWHDFGPLAL